MNFTTIVVVLALSSLAVAFMRPGDHPTMVGPHVVAGLHNKERTNAAINMYRNAKFTWSGFEGNDQVTVTLRDTKGNEKAYDVQAIEGEVTVPISGVHPGVLNVHIKGMGNGLEGSSNCELALPEIKRPW